MSGVRHQRNKWRVVLDGRVELFFRTREIALDVWDGYMLLGEHDTVVLFDPCGELVRA